MTFKYLNIFSNWFYFVYDLIWFLLNRIYLILIIVSTDYINTPEFLYFELSYPGNPKNFTVKVFYDTFWESSSVRELNTYLGHVYYVY